MKSKCSFKVLLFCILLTIIAFPLTLNATPSDLSISTLSQPIPVPSTTHQIITYELHFINKGKQPLRISRIEIWNQKLLLNTYVDYSLIANSLIYDPQRGPVTVKKIELKKDMGTFTFITLNFDKNAVLPKTLQHKIWITTSNDDKSTASSTIQTFAVPVSTEKPIKLAPPLHGSQWIAEAAFSPTSYHRRAILPIDGNFYLAQRYAIDWERMCNDGLEVHKNMHDNANWQAYGYEVLAVAEGVISKIATNSIPDNVPPGLPKPPPPLSDVSGNYIILDTVQNNKHYYILYAHMQPGSIKVKLGQKVMRGQVIGLVGNSGNSAAPHLHMHVTDTNYAEKSNGVPFIFETATIQGTAEEVDEDYGIWVKPQSLNQQKFTDIMPTENQLFYFDELNKRCP